MQRSVANNTARTTDFATAPGRLDISEAMVPPDVCIFTIATASVAVANDTSVSDAMVPPADYQSKQHTLLIPLTHHWETLLLRPADGGSVGGYKVGYDECACTTNFATAPGRLDISRVSDAMVPPADDQPKQHTLLMPPSHHRATISLRHADVGIIGGYDVGYNFPPPDNQPKQHTLPMHPSHHCATLSLRHADVGSVGGYTVG